MEISGSFSGRAAREAYEAWRIANSMAQHHPRMVDISYVTDADEDGVAVLRAWQRQRAQIVTSTAVSGATANSILSAPASQDSRPTTVLVRFVSTLSRHSAVNPAPAESGSFLSASTKQRNAEKAAFPLFGEMESHVR